MRPRIVIRGDEELGSQYAELALLELLKLKEAMTFQNPEQDQRWTVFNDGTVIRCQSVFGDKTITIETVPPAVEEEEAKEYEEGALLVVLRKLVGAVYDYWYWNLDRNLGYHENPNAILPTTPEIITKYWSCDGLSEELYYSAVTPAFVLAGSGGCADSCGIISFTEGACCDSPQAVGDDNDTWYTLPCGGTATNTVEGWVGKHTVSCSECGNGTETLYTPGAQNTRSRTSRQTINCDEGYSWSLSYDTLTELIEIGPRSKEGGSESSSIAVAKSSDCSSYEKHWFRCYAAWDEEDCICYNPMGWLPIHRYGECEGGLTCKGYHGDDGDKQVFYGVDTYGAIYGSQYQGCAIMDVTSKAAGDYTLNSIPVVTSVTAGAKSTTFTGSWSGSHKAVSTEQVNNVQVGWDSACLTCGAGTGVAASTQSAHYTFAETSYGIAGWSTVVADDGRIGILIPKLVLAASANSVDGSVSGSIISTTTALLRIVDDSEHDYELADGNSNYSLSSLPTSRDDLRIKPECYNASEIPLDIDLQGFHWLVETQMSGETMVSRDDNILTAFVFDSSFYAYLTSRNLDEAWQNQELSAFEQWVVDNDLEGYNMFLYRRSDYEEEIYY